MVLIQLIKTGSEVLNDRFIVTIFTDKNPVVMDSLDVLLQFKLTDKFDTTRFTRI